MNTKCCSVLAAILISAAPLVSYAGSLDCHGNIISPGVSEQQLLEACGCPTSRNGADWTYEMPGSLPIVVTLGNGVVMFIRDADDGLDASVSRDL
ncbi:MAG: DUF2845 domain-containing protein [Pseudomonadota bacterium]|nr:DUF2845 domain-containing protein [Pseudomonadota bacterium]